MSYRLIDANAIASQRPEVNDMPCIYADLDKGLDGHHYDLRGANTLQAENAKLRELCADLYAEMIEYSDAPNYNASVWSPKLRELGIEVNA